MKNIKLIYFYKIISIDDHDGKSKAYSQLRISIPSRHKPRAASGVFTPNRLIESPGTCNSPRRPKPPAGQHSPQILIWRKYMRSLEELFRLKDIDKDRAQDKNNYKRIVDTTRTVVNDFIGGLSFKSNILESLENIISNASPLCNESRDYFIEQMPLLFDHVKASHHIDLLSALFERYLSSGPSDDEFLRDNIPFSTFFTAFCNSYLVKSSYSKACLEKLCVGKQSKVSLDNLSKFDTECSTKIIRLVENYTKLPIEIRSLIESLQKILVSYQDGKYAMHTRKIACQFFLRVVNPILFNAAAKNKPKHGKITDTTSGVLSVALQHLANNVQPDRATKFDEAFRSGIYSNLLDRWNNELKSWIFQEIDSN